MRITHRSPTAPTASTTTAPSATKQPSATSSTVLPAHLPKLTRLDVQRLAPRAEAAALAGVVAAHVVAEVDTGVKGASGICHLPGGQTLVVDDDKGIAWMVKDGSAKTLVKSAEDLEGICASRDGRDVWVVQEGTRRVERYAVDHDDDGRLRLTSAGSRKLPKFKDVEDNKGWEGLAFLPASSAGQPDQLVCVHEGSPRRLGIFALPELDTGFTLKLPKDAKDLLPDLADVAIDHHGHVFVLTDEGQRVVEFALVPSSRVAPGALLEQPSLVTVSSFELPLKKGSKPEGLAFDDVGRLWVALDTNGRALVLELDR